MLTPLIRVLKFSIQDMLRNASLATMTVVVLSLLLISVNTVLGIRFLTQQAVVSVKDKIDLSIYLKPSVRPETIAALEDRIKTIPEVKGTRTVSREEALESFKNAYASQPEIIAALAEVGENPLGPALVVKTDDPKDYQKVITILDEPQFADTIEDKTFADTQLTIEKIDVVSNRVEQFVWAISFIFGLVAIIIVYTTIRVAIYTERVEIAVKKLVGASNWFIRGPYLVEAIILSTISLGISLIAVSAATQTLDPYFSPLLSQNNILTNYLFTNILMLAGFEYLAVLILTLGTSAIAMRQYLKT